MMFAESVDGGAPINCESIEPAGRRRSLEDACLCAKIADEFRGEDTLVLNLTKVTPIFDYFVITTATSRRQMHAIAEEVDRVLEERGSTRLGIEGYEQSTWILQDYGDVVLHVFEPESRGIYDLEGLWADTARIDWRPVAQQVHTGS